MQQDRKRSGLPLILLLLFSALIQATWADDTLTIMTWGGAYEEAQRKAFFEPFTQATGIEIETVQYSGGLQEIREQALAGEAKLDLIDLVLADNIVACKDGLLEPIDHAELLQGDYEQDFYEHALTRCGVGQVIFSTVIAFDARQFPGEKPNLVRHFFDLEAFPGKRGLQRKPIAVLEWALMSYGVPKRDVYSLLSTPRGLDLAFKRLDKIKKKLCGGTNPKNRLRCL